MQHSSDLAAAGNRPISYPPSLYAADLGEVAARPSLDGDIAADLLVVGGGFTGLSTALHAAERGMDVVLVEAARVGWGASGRNGGHVLSGYSAELDDIARLVGKNNVRPFWELSVEAVSLLWSSIERHGIACEATRGHMMAANRPRHLRTLEAEARQLAGWGYGEMSLLDRAAIGRAVGSTRYVGGRLDPQGGHLQPLRLALGLADAAVRAGVRLYEGTPIVRLEGTTGISRTGRVRAKAVVLAGNAYLGDVAPEIGRPLDRKALRAATYLIATAPLGAALARSLIRDDVAVCDTNYVLDYYRLTRDHRLLFGAELSTEPRNETWIRQTLGRRMVRVFPQLADVAIDHAWYGLIDLSASRMPHLGRLADDVWFAQGFSGHGVALTQLAGRLMAASIAGDQLEGEAFDRLARLPARDIPGGHLLRSPLLSLARTWFRLRDLL